MAFDFRYKVSLVVTHADLDVSKLTIAMPDLTPCKTVNKGDVRVLRSGVEHIAQNSVWIARFNEGLLDSEYVDFSSFLEECLSTLESIPDISELFKDIRRQGNVYLEVLIENHTSHFACLVEPSVLGVLAKMGLTLDIEYQHK